MTTAIYGLVLLAVIVVAILAGVKLRAAFHRRGDVRVYDFGADLALPSRLSARSYQIALYLTMKSRLREPPPVGGRAPSR